jgi:predicted metallopeptidase
MGKQLNFEYKGKEYILEFTRESIKQMEREGFVAGDVVTKPMLTLPKLFAGAFKAHHKFDIKQKTIDEIFELFKNKSALVEKLAEMYSEPMETLMDDENIDEGNAIAWDANF